MSYYDESYPNPRKRRPLPKYRPPAARKPARPKTAAERKAERTWEIGQVKREIALAEKAKRQGNHGVARMIMDTVDGRLNWLEGKKPTGIRRSDKRPGSVLSDADLRDVRRRLDSVTGGAGQHIARSNARRRLDLMLLELD